LVLGSVILSGDMIFFSKSLYDRRHTNKNIGTLKYLVVNSVKYEG